VSRAARLSWSDIEANTAVGFHQALRIENQGSSCYWLCSQDEGSWYEPPTLGRTIGRGDGALDSTSSEPNPRFFTASRLPAAASSFWSHFARLLAHRTAWSPVDVHHQVGANKHGNAILQVLMKSLVPLAWLPRGYGYHYQFRPHGGWK